MKLHCYLTPFKKINSTWIKVLNIRPETIIFLEENMGRILLDMDTDNDIFYLILKIKAMKAKINTWY